jgi:2-polyprenyl-6-methoxyphenol hydroxylase-like FAD-dependent oxidoreductase
MCKEDTMDTRQNAAPVLQTQCCIAGCGPAGAMLGFLLARRGIDVVVLEKHGDFLRDFRGDSIHPSTLAVMQELGLADQLLSLPHSTASMLKVSIAQSVITMADFRHLKTPWPYLTFLPQWDFLNFLTEKARQYPTFHLIMNAEAKDPIEESGSIRGIRYHTHDGLHEVRATLTVAADGRTSRLRQQAGMQPIEQVPPMDVLWFQLSHPEGIHLVFLPPTPRSCNPVSASGRSPTRPLPAVASRPWMSCKRCKPSDVSFFRTTRSIFAGTRFFTGGLCQIHDMLHAMR